MEAKQSFLNQNLPVIGDQPQQAGINSNRLSIFIVISVLFTGVVTGSLVYLWQKTANKKIINSLEQKITFLEKQILMMKDIEITSQPTFSPELSPTPKVDLTANWETYINTKIGFSFQYPKAWTKKEPVAEYDPTIVYIYANEKFGEKPEFFQYYLWVTKVEELPKREYTKETINRYTVYRTDEEPSRFGSLAYFITKDETEYIVISLTPYNAEKPFPAQNRYVNTFTQVLSTFKFIE